MKDSNGEQLYALSVSGTRDEWLHFCRWLHEQAPVPKIGASILLVVPGCISGHALRESWEAQAPEEET